MNFGYRSGTSFMRKKIEVRAEGGGVDGGKILNFEFENVLSFQPPWVGLLVVVGLVNFFTF